MNDTLVRPLAKSQYVARTAAVRVGAIEVSAPIQVAAGQSAVILTGLKATVGGFVSISGNFGVQKVSASKPGQEELIVVANSAEARVEAGVALRAGVRDARLAMVIRGDQKLAVQATGAADLNLGDGFATASATSIGVAFNNTGADVANRTLTVSVGATTVSAPLSVRNGQASVVINGLQAQVAGFVTLSGDFGVERVRGSSPAADELLVVSNNASAGLKAGSVLRAGVRNATVALAIRGDGKLALQATGAAELNLGEGFASASVESIGVAFNNTGALIALGTGGRVGKGKEPGGGLVRLYPAEHESIEREVVPLHGELDARAQDRALARGSVPRVVLATNVAETSVTVDGVDIARGSDTNENRNIDISGYCASIVNNSAHVFRQYVPGTKYMTVDGECVLAQTEANSFALAHRWTGNDCTHPAGSSALASGPIFFYKMVDVEGSVVTGNANDAGEYMGAVFDATHDGWKNNVCKGNSQPCKCGSAACPAPAAMAV
jgi:hypothetical protein